MGTLHSMFGVLYPGVCIGVHPTGKGVGVKEGVSSELGKGTRP
jgi:hypothetical protein